MTSELVDLSAFQAPRFIDYGKAAGVIAGIIAKATDGIGSPDHAFDAHVAGARAAGILVGAYHFLRVRVGLPQDAESQCDEFCARYESADCELLPALDVEPAIPPQTPAPTASAWNEAMHTWITRCRANLGCYPMLYSYPWFWMSLGPIVRTPLVAACPSWWADYTRQQAIAPMPWNAAPALHQYTDHGTVPGIQGFVDRSRAPSLDALRRVTTAIPPAAA